MLVGGANTSSYINDWVGQLPVVLKHLSTFNTTVAERAVVSCSPQVKIIKLLGKDGLRLILSLLTNKGCCWSSVLTVSNPPVSLVLRLSLPALLLPLPVVFPCTPVAVSRAQSPCPTCCIYHQCWFTRTSILHSMLMLSAEIYTDVNTQC